MYPQQSVHHVVRRACAKDLVKFGTARRVRACKVAAVMFGLDPGHSYVPGCG